MWMQLHQARQEGRMCYFSYFEKKMSSQGKAVLRAFVIFVIILYRFEMEWCGGAFKLKIKSSFVRLDNLLSVLVKVNSV
jgi:hypothetical protein